MSAERGATLLSVVAGNAPEPSRVLASGTVVPPFGVGTHADWVIEAPGVEPVHFFVTFDGNDLYVTRATPTSRLQLRGVDVGTEWQLVRLPCELYFGGACVSLFREAKSPTTQPLGQHPGVGGGSLSAVGPQRTQPMESAFNQTRAFGSFPREAAPAEVQKTETLGFAPVQAAPHVQGSQAWQAAALTPMKIPEVDDGFGSTVRLGSPLAAAERAAVAPVIQVAATLNPSPAVVVGTPVQQPVPQQAAPQYAAPQYAAAPQPTVPEYAALPQAAPQYAAAPQAALPQAAPQYAAPEPTVPEPAVPQQRASQVVPAAQQHTLQSQQPAFSAAAPAPAAVVVAGAQTQAASVQSGVSSPVVPHAEPFNMQRSGEFGPTTLNDGGALRQHAARVADATPSRAFALAQDYVAEVRRASGTPVPDGFVPAALPNANPAAQPNAAPMPGVRAAAAQTGGDGSPKKKGSRLAASWREASLVRKITVVLMPFCLAAVVLVPPDQPPPVHPPAKAKSVRVSSASSNSALAALSPSALASASGAAPLAKGAALSGSPAASGSPSVSLLGSPSVSASVAAATSGSPAASGSPSVSASASPSVAVIEPARAPAATRARDALNAAFDGRNSQAAKLYDELAKDGDRVFVLAARLAREDIVLKPAISH